MSPDKQVDHLAGQRKHKKIYTEVQKMTANHLMQWKGKRHRKHTNATTMATT